MFGISNIWMAVAGAVLFGLVVWKTYSVGYNYAAADCTAKITQIKLDIQKEYAEQIKKLIEAAKISQEQQQDLSEQLSEAEANLDEQIAKNKELAEKDPNAGGCGIGLDSTDRLNSIK